MNRLLLIAVLGVLVATIAFVAFSIANPQWFLWLFVGALIYPLTSLAADVPLYLPILVAAIAVVGWRMWRRRARVSTGQR